MKLKYKFDHKPLTKAQTETLNSVQEDDLTLADHLLAFQVIHGDDWENALYDFHMGRPRYESKNLMPYMRRIRNGITGNPSDLPDLRPSIVVGCDICESTADVLTRGGQPLCKNCRLRSRD
jgi:hypothetical protein